MKHEKGIASIALVMMILTGVIIIGTSVSTVRIARSRLNTRLTSATREFREALSVRDQFVNHIRFGGPEITYYDPGGSGLGNCNVSPYFYSNPFSGVGGSYQYCLDSDGVSLFLISRF